jgi:hypothetical protein
MPATKNIISVTPKGLDYLQFQKDNLEKDELAEGRSNSSGWNSKRSKVSIGKSSNHKLNVPGMIDTIYTNRQTETLSPWHKSNRNSPRVDDLDHDAYEILAQKGWRFYDAYQMYQDQISAKQDYDDYLGGYIAIPHGKIMKGLVSPEPASIDISKVGASKIYNRFERLSQVNGSRHPRSPTKGESALEHDYKRSKSENPQDSTMQGTQGMNGRQSFYKKKGENYYIRDAEDDMNLNLAQEDIFKQFEDREYVQQKMSDLKKNRKKITLAMPLKPLNDLARQLDTIYKPNLTQNVSIRPQLKNFISHS